MNQLPDRADRSGLPAERRLTSQQFEVVIRRAAELQARAAEEGGETEMSEAEVLRIGREIGIAPEYLRRALAESSRPAAGPPTLGERLFGPGWVSATRAVPGDADRVRLHLEQYLLQRERLVVIRRLADRTIYERARGMDLARVLRAAHDSLAGGQPPVGAGFRLRRARKVEASVQPLEEGYSHVTLAADLGNVRVGLATGGVVGGGGGAAVIATVLGIAVDPAAAALGLPVLGGSLWGVRSLQGHTAARAQLHLESLLDCLERGEPLVRASAPRR